MCHFSMENKTAKTLAKYSQEIKSRIGLPNMLVRIQVEASADFGRYSEMFAEYEIMKAEFMNKTKFSGEKPLSDNSCENKWLLTEEGKKWMYLKHYLNGLKQITKSIDSATYVANMEAKNQI
jgi:hypothetical protein